MQQKSVTALRIAAALVALGALALAVLELALLGTAWMGHPVVGVRVAAHPTELALRVLPWGIGFSVLALAVIRRPRGTYEVLFAAFFLAIYALWGGIAQPLFRGEPWQAPALILMDALGHSIGIRFTQLFPRALTYTDVAQLGGPWLKKTVSPVLAALTKPRFFWPFALVLELAGRIPAAHHGPYFAHVIVWLVLGTTYLYVSYKRGSPEERRRIFWILEGVVVFLTLESLWLAEWAITALRVVSLDLAFWGRLQTVVEAWATLICFALAIFHSDAFDSGLILRRTTVLSTSGALVVIIFIALQTTVGEFMTAIIGINSHSGDIVVGIVASLAFRPLSERIDNHVRKWTSRTD